MPLSQCSQCGFVCRVLFASAPAPECPECGATMSFIARGPTDGLRRNREALRRGRTRVPPVSRIAAR